MEERRFDDLTRALGQATSRRGVLKGLLAGVAAVLVGRTLEAPGAAAASCNAAHCRDAAYREWIAYEQATCNNLCHDRNLFVACFGCRMNANRLLQKWLHDCETGDGCLSVAGEVCCGGSCANVGSDPNNCGSCGNVCPPGNSCIHGECQCGDNGTMCNNECVDTQNDSHHCGNCETQCKTCESCAGGVCGPVECGSGKTCCNDQCVDDCPQGQQRDPETCQCSPCAGQPNGTSCGTNEVCCQQGCFSNQCSDGKTFTYDSCGCVCEPTQCPPGQLQDPETCECIDLCASVTCPECQICDQTSGACVPVGDNTACGSGQVCCGGACKDECSCPDSRPRCGDTCCGSGESCWEGRCYDTSSCSVLCDGMPNGTNCGAVPGTPCSICLDCQCVALSCTACGTDNSGICCQGRCQDSCGICG